MSAMHYFNQLYPILHFHMTIPAENTLVHSLNHFTFHTYCSHTRPYHAAYTSLANKVIFDGASFHVSEVDCKTGFSIHLHCFYV